MNIFCPQISTERHRFFKILCAFICVHLWLIFLSGLTQAQNLHQWGNISLFHGLPSDKVHAITQTNDGIFWFGTENGLAKFDGRRVQTIQIDQVTQVYSLAVGKDGTLFVGTNTGVFRLQSDKFVQIAETDGRKINSIFAAEKTYFAADSGEFFEFENETAKLLIQTDVPITSVVVKGEQIYFGTAGRGIFELKNNEAKELKFTIRPYFINDLDFADDGSLWLAARTKPLDSGLFGYFQNADFAKFGSQLGEITTLKSLGENLWIGTESKGIYHFRGGNEVSHFTFENTSGGLRSNQIFDVFADREGVIWFGTDKGICRFDELSPYNYSFSEDSNGNFVRSIYRANDKNLYVGTNQGLQIFDGNSWTEDEEFVNKSIYSIGETADKKLVIGTPTDNIRAVQNLNGKTYTIIFGKGLFENERLIYPHGALISMYATDGKIFIGTVEDGILEFSDGKVKPLGILQNKGIRQFSGTLEKGLWIATEKGLYLWQNSEIKGVIEDTDFRSVLVSGDKILAGSLNRGLFQIKFDEEFGWMFSNLNVEQGLPSSVIFAILPVENSWLIGTGKGVSRYSFNNVLPEVAANRIISERVHSGKEISEGIKLDYPQNTLNVEVTGLSSRTFPENFQYGYLLKNGKGEVILKKLSNDSQISFENLSADNYSVEIYAFNQDLLKSNPFKFNFSIAKAPFPWTSTALAVLLVIAVVALVMAIIERKQLADKNKEIAAARFDLANEAERERRRIAQDLHDQTLADLRKLMLKSDQLPSDNSEFRAEIETVSDEIRRICEDLSPSVLENVGFRAALEFLLKNTFENCNFLCSDNLDEEMNFPPNVQMQIYRIAQEVLNNIKRHAEADLVEMKISIEEGFKMIIKNNGKQFSPDFDNLPKGRGISNIKSRAELIEAEIFWENDNDGKTIFTLTKAI